MPADQWERVDLRISLDRRTLIVDGDLVISLPWQGYRFVQHVADGFTVEREQSVPLLAHPTKVAPVCRTCHQRPIVIRGQCLFCEAKRPPVRPWAALWSRLAFWRHTPHVP